MGKGNGKRKWEKERERDREREREGVFYGREQRIQLIEGRAILDTLTWFVRLQNDRLGKIYDSSAIQIRIVATTLNATQ